MPKRRVDLRLRWEQLQQLSRREIKRRYKDTALGMLWIVFFPLVQSLVISAAFILVFGQQLPGQPVHFFPLIVFSGFVLWNFVSNSASQALTAFSGNRELVINQPLSLLLLPLANTVIKLNDFVIDCVVLAVLVSIFIHHPTVAWFALIPLTFALTVFVAGLCLLFSLLYQFARDVGHLMSFILSVWFWLSPIFYPAELIGSRFRFFNLNPLVHFLAAFRQILLYNQADGLKILKLTVMSLVLFAFSLLIFNRRKKLIYDLI